MDTTGIVLAILAAFFMGTIGVFSKITGLPAETITFFRLFLGAGFLALFLLVTRQARALRRWPTWPVVINGSLLAGFIIFYIQAMNLTSMANAIMIVYLAPVVASVFAHFRLGERLGGAGWLLIAASMVGFAAMMDLCRHGPKPPTCCNIRHPGLLRATGRGFLRMDPVRGISLPAATGGLRHDHG